MPVVSAAPTLQTQQPTHAVAADQAQHTQHAQHAAQTEHTAQAQHTAQQLPAVTEAVGEGERVENVEQGVTATQRRGGPVDPTQQRAAPPAPTNPVATAWNAGTAVSPNSSGMCVCSCLDACVGFASLT